MKEDTAIRSADLDLGYFDLNSASEESIAQIPGVGQNVAQLIIKNRPFETIEDLARVPGISQDNIDDLVRGGATVGKPIQSHPEQERSFEDT